ncbi:efflux RND transporter periplasmic adaptor subunit [Marinilabiliaceae bacterium ANBcel2]|nr:efflux RND transporter periplasmic adaptor subunit [Marinilabiliaceae bacterium ANBcel2]
MKVVIFLSAVVGLLLLNYGCGQTDKESVSPRNVKVVSPHSAGTTITREFNGVVEESRNANLSFRVGGPLVGVFAEEGDFVREGELLASIDPRDYQVQLQAAKAQYHQAKAEYERFKELYKQDKLPVNTFEKLETAFTAAKSSYENAQNALADTRLKAPFSGTVFQKNISNHETIAAGIVVYTIIDIEDLEIVFGVPESIVAEMANTKEVTVDISGKTIAAKVKSVSNKSGEDNLFETRISVQNPDYNEIRPGMNAKVTVETHREALKATSLPVEAIFYNNKKPFVWIYDETTGTVKSRSVQIGRVLSGGYIEVTDGVNKSDKIVSAGVHSLYEDQRVEKVNKL